MQNLDWEKRFERMPENAPPKWMFRKHPRHSREHRPDPRTRRPGPFPLRRAGFCRQL